MIIIMRDIINKVENKKFLFDVKCSKSLSDEIEKLGGEIRLNVSNHEKTEFLIKLPSNQITTEIYY
jgi:hypothetical protein